jgi:hypothetical protein
MKHEKVRTVKAAWPISRYYLYFRLKRGREEGHKGTRTSGCLPNTNPELY